ncbi:hypothetical protein [Thiocapsa roseopersicina]|uniref:Uncharacterized protein n=1 Tax=Thiocapsa roseopersicina TaxID=1058 RepID=A0A1H2XPY5_THIRO|nr:hypothetical protein [Thiocapsa roseopersicina]SDW94564.1 hypothetical protein SAMN05421783_11156 [Thiocapsa roseopersicina]
MSKLVQAASIIALAAAASSAGAWYNAPVAPIMTPEMAEQQMQAISAQHEAMAEQQHKAIEQAMEAHRKMMEQRAADFARMPSGIDSGFPEMPPVPEFAQYPAMPEMPAMPEFGQIPAMPEMPAMPEFGQIPAMPEMPAMPEFGQIPELPAMPEFVKTRMDEMDAHRAKVQQGIQERRAAFKAESEQRRAQHPRAVERTHMAGYAPHMHPAMMPSHDCAPKVQAPEQQAAAPAPAATAQ